MNGLCWKLLFDPGHLSVYERLITYIKAGAYPHVAAQVIKIGVRTWDEWRSKAACGDTDERWMVDGINPYQMLFDRINAASAEARVLAEVEVRQADPKFWLTQGPGKTDPNGGWGRDNIEVTHTVEGHIEHEHTIDEDVLEHELNNHLGSVIAELVNLGIADLTDRGKGMIEGAVVDDKD